MFTVVLRQAARSARSTSAASTSLRSLSTARPSALALSFAARPTLSFVASRTYASGAGLDKDTITARIMDIMKSFEKVDGGKLTPTATFTSDLGLDSLDAVEVVMAIEEEFSVEIPDAEADEITSVGQAIDYIAKTPEAL